MLFTRCPECETTFRITADALRKADGQVRCGRCTKVFNAYNELRRKARKRAAARQAQAVESERASPRAPSDAAAGSPDDTARDGRDAATTAPVEAAAALADAAGGASTPGTAAQPGASTPDTVAQPGASTPDTVAQPGTAPAPAAEPAADGAASRLRDSEKDVAIGDISFSGVIAELEASVADETDSVDASKKDAPDTNVSAIKLLEKNGLRPGADASSHGTVEHSKETAAQDETPSTAPAWVILDEAPPAPRATRQWMAASIAAAALLVLQVLHHYRNDIAVLAVVGPVVQDTYALVGAEIAPDWDLAQYEIVVDWDSVTQPGTEGEGNLKIAARIRNKGPQALPLPHVQVQLKDRWESTIGSRVFAPSEYLPRGAALDRPMSEGQVMLATLDIFDPGPQAYGFELDVCVDAHAGALRCAGDEVFR